MLVACVFIPDFPLRAVLRHDPGLRSAAVAIVEGVPPSCFVIATNPQARQMGVVEGMTRLEAAQAPSLAIRRRSPAEEASAHAALLDLGWSISPRVEEAAPDTVVIDVEGLGRLFASPEAVAERLRSGAAKLGLDAQIAVASNIEAARHAARGIPGITVIPEGREGDILAGLHVDLLATDCLDQAPLQSNFKSRISHPNDKLAFLAEILVTLDRWGVRTFGDLAALPTADLAERLGQEGVRLQRFARGQGARTLLPAEPELHFEEAIELEDSIDMLDPLMFVLGRMLDSLCARLRARSLATNGMQLKMWLDPHSPIVEDHGEPQVAVVPLDKKFKHEVLTTGSGPGTAHHERNPDPPTPNLESRTLTLPVPTLNKKTLLKLWLLNLQSEPPRGPILKVTLEAAPAKPRAAQGGLFQPIAPDPEKLEITLARIAGVVGKGRAGSPEILDTHRPGAFRMRRFTVPEERLETRKSKFESPVPSLDPRMALRVFRPSRPATVEAREGIPVRVYAGEIRGDVVARGGPWRTSGEWWGDAWEQDEWDLEVCQSAVVGRQLSVIPIDAPSTPDAGRRTPNSVLYRLYRDIATGQWFVRGVYD